MTMETAIPPLMALREPSLRDLVLVVDDDPLVGDLLCEIVRSIGCEVLRAETIVAARQQVRQNEELKIILCDQQMLDGTGLDFFREIKGTHPRVTRLLVTGFPELKIALAAINEGEIFRFLTKPLTDKEVIVAVKEALAKHHLQEENQRLQAVLLTANEQLQKANASLQAALAGSIKFCLDILEKFDHVLASHSMRVTRSAVSLGRSLGLTAAQLETLGIAAQLHDIGLVSVSRSFHHEQQQIGWEDLPPLQQAAIQAHPRTGADLVRFLQNREVSLIILAHHEWFNGGGYPSHLPGELIPTLAAILAVCDAYDELPMEREEAARFIEDNLGIRFNPEAGRAFLRLISEQPQHVSKEREVLMSELVEGMNLACDIYSAQGVLLIPKGQRLTAKLVGFLHHQNESDPLTQRIFVEK